MRTRNSFCRGAVCLLVLIVVAGWGLVAQAGWPQVATSADGSEIAYEVHGTGEPTLVFVHGWSCDARYWREQVPYFSNNHRVVVVDLAGHGHSAARRTEYTMTAFGQDVQAVCEAVASDEVILIGHSMGGSVIAEAARLMPARVVGLIGVDTLEDVEYTVTQEDCDMMLGPLNADFGSGARLFVASMMRPGMSAELREWILADMSSATPEVAMSAINELMGLYIRGDAARIFDEIEVPVVTVNADMWPVNAEANRRHMKSYEAIVLKGADHFLMLNRVEDFNAALAEAIGKVQLAAAD